MLQIRVQDELLWKAYPIEPQVPESLDSLCCSLLNRPNCEVDNYGQVNDGEDRQTTSSSSSTRVSWIMPCDASKSCNRGSKGLAELPSLQPPNTFTRSWAARDSQRARILLCPPQRTRTNSPSLSTTVTSCPLGTFATRSFWGARRSITSGWPSTCLAIMISPT